MIIVFVLLFIILTILFGYLVDKSCNYEELFAFLTIFSGVVFGISFIALISLLITVSGGRTINQRIEMYQEQNNKIEEDISVLVENYMNYESETFKECSSDSSITLVSLYPELKSDALVEQQCNLYVENNKKIMELKEEQINLTVKKWWLYFGK